MRYRVARPTRLFALLALLAGAGTGCALSTRNATLTYPPPASGSVVAVAHAETPAPQPGGTMVLLPIEDRRADTYKLGNVRNALGMKLAPVVAANSVPLWVQSAMELELTNAGYSVVTDAPATDSALTVGGAILKAHTDAYLGYSAEVVLEVQLSRAGCTLFSRTFVGKGSGGANMTATAKSYAKSLSYALADALGLVIAEVNRAVASTGEAGTPAADQVDNIGYCAKTQQSTAPVPAAASGEAP